ncbi:MAG: hypothetical protein KDK27_18295, partial [Leptospiraceae bacterium]|nr:hypothetical protein [Leptospiraceae bacterium]
PFFELRISKMRFDGIKKRYQSSVDWRVGIVYSTIAFESRTYYEFGFTIGQFDYVIEFSRNTAND